MLYQPNSWILCHRHSCALIRRSTVSAAFLGLRKYHEFDFLFQFADDMVVVRWLLLHIIYPSSRHQCRIIMGVKRISMITTWNLHILIRFHEGTCEMAKIKILSLIERSHSYNSCKCFTLEYLDQLQAEESIWTHFRKLDIWE